MKKNARILVPVDYEETSETVISKALDLADALDGTLTVLHVWRVPAMIGADLMVNATATEAITLGDWIREQAEKKMEQLLTRVRRNSAKVEIEGRLETGDPAATIVELAKIQNYDLIVMGTRGKKMIDRLIMGSVAEKVVRTAETPVVTIRSIDKK